MKKFTHLDVTLIEKKTRYKGFFTVNSFSLQHRMYNGEETGVLQRECLERGHAVGVLAYDPWKDTLVFLQQFRIGAYANIDANKEAVEQTSPWLLEIIAGIVEPDEIHEEVAHREAYEEAGCSLLTLETIGEFYLSPGGTTETIKLFCACVKSDSIGGVHGLKEEGEDIQVMVVSFEKAVEWLNEGRLNNASTMISMQWLMLNRSELRSRWQSILPNHLI